VKTNQVFVWKQPARTPARNNRWSRRKSRRLGNERRRRSVSNV